MIRALDRGDYDTDPDDERFRGVEPKRRKGFVSEAWYAGDIDCVQIIYMIPIIGFMWPLLCIWMYEGSI